MDAARKTQAARHGALLFGFVAALELVDDLIGPGRGHLHTGWLDAMALAAAVMCAATLAIPWRRLPWGASLVLAPAAFALLVLRGMAGVSTYTYGLPFAMVFSWLGASYPRFVPTAMLPLAAGAYLLPAMLTGHEPNAAATALFVLPVYAFIGETLAGRATRLRRVQDDAMRSARQLAVVASASSQVNQLNADQVLHAVTTSLSELGFAAGAIAVIDGDGQTFRLRDSFGLSADGRGVAHELDGTLVGLAASRGALVVASDVANLPITRFGPLGHDQPWRTAAAVPLWTDGAVRGALIAVTGRRLAHGSPDLDALAILGDQASQALANVRRFDAAQRRQEDADREARTDALTGIGNRRHATEALASLQPGRAVVLLDLDRFKAVNDTLGHEAGDAVLADFGAYLSESLRDGDVVARWGGEEFVVILDGEGVDVVAERLVAGWRARGPLTTCSAGFAVHEADTSAVATLGKADSALYEAKGGGRDRAIRFGAPPKPGRSSNRWHAARERDAAKASHGIAV